MVPIPNGRGRHRAAPFGIGPWDGARVASQQSPILRPGQGYCSRPKLMFQLKGGRRSQDLAGCSIPVALSQLEIPPVGANSMRSLDAAAWASNGRGQQHDAVYGVALAARNSHQINPHLPWPLPGRAAHEYRERYLAKECVGSNRLLTRTIATSRGDDNRDEFKNVRSRNGARFIDQEQKNRRLRRAQPLRKTR